MTTTPKISIIIPVYNAEKYLHQCLDSVVNQTLHDIEIICVNDGSTDSSLAILREYADKDSRIEIIDKPNGGASSARNAAYPHIRGKYTQFIDSDDWVELDLCEKTYQRSEETDASMTVFFYTGEGGNDTPSYKQITPDDKMIVEEKLPVLDINEACIKLWRSDFLLGNKLYFPEGLVMGEDCFVNWQAVTLADKISIVPERLYHYRRTPGSIIQIRGDHTMHIIPIYNKTREYLLESGYYTAYREKFISRKLCEWYWHHCRLPASMKSRFVVMIRESLTEGDREFCRTAPKNIIPKHIRLFYEMIEGGTVEAVKFHAFMTIDPIVKVPERLLRQWIIKPLKKRLRAAQKQ